MVPRDFFQKFGVPISWGSLSQLPRWVFLGQYYPLKGPRCIKTPRVFKTIKLFCTDDRIQLIITFLESIRIHQNQNKMVKWTSRYCPILKLLETVEDFAFHKHNYHSAHCECFSEACSYLLTLTVICCHLQLEISTFCLMVKGYLVFEG